MEEPDTNHSERYHNCQDKFLLTGLWLWGTMSNINYEHNLTQAPLPSLNVNKHVITFQSRQNFHSHCHENLRIHFPVTWIQWSLLAKGSSGSIPKPLSCKEIHFHVLIPPVLHMSAQTYIFISSKNSFCHYSNKIKMLNATDV
jgi:hypothetical protein